MRWVSAGSKAFPTKSTGTLLFSLCTLTHRASWEFLFAFIIVIYTTSAVLLMLMARCLNRLPVIQETLLRARAEALESMMFYVFIYIIYGLCVCVLYGLNVMINYHFQSWEPRFVSSYVLELVIPPNFDHFQIFYAFLTSRGILTSFIFLDNFWHRGGKQDDRDPMGNNGNAWYREVQPLFNNMIRNQILDIFSNGVKRSAHEQGIDDPHKAFNPVTGIHGNILDRESYYSEVCAYSIDPVAGCDDVVSGDRANRGVE